MPFDENNTSSYQSLRAEDFREIVRGEPRGRTKATPMMQIADLVLYSRIIGDAADSPIVTAEDQFSGGLGLTYTFDRTD
ncbi:MipA/OmpV family protein [Aminobacter sp. MDW-2]|uniref:MipA/OmpV family protein n=1 Tax=Aminobacter sp. MDW-2 TaxID=2666139 RepID=UPI00163BFD0B|nr:MipA/OmpV family protein [Aminobacter sp. MDW-2]